MYADTLGQYARTIVESKLVHNTSSNNDALFLGLLACLEQIPTSIRYLATAVKPPPAALPVLAIVLLHIAMCLHYLLESRLQGFPAAGNRPARLLNRPRLFLDRLGSDS